MAGKGTNWKAAPAEPAKGHEQPAGADAGGATGTPATAAASPPSPLLLRMREARGRIEQLRAQRDDRRAISAARRTGLERAREERVAALKRDNSAILATPLMSEGSISPMQVGMMSPRARKRLEQNAMRRLALEATIRDIEKPGRQRMAEARKQQRRDAAGELLGAKRRIEDLSRVGRGKRGTIRPTYQRAIDQELAKVRTLRERFPDIYEQVWAEG